MSSSKWRSRAETVIPGGVNSPVRAFKHVGGEPIWFEKAQGAYLFDVDGRQYVDFCLSFGPMILGHAHPKVVEAVVAQASKGMSFGACHPMEVELAEWILKGYSFLEQVRLVNSGTEAVMTAVRLARGFTGRSKIVQFEGCYHGHSDGLLAKAGSGVAELSESTSKGVPASVVQDTLLGQFNDLDHLESLFEHNKGSIACVLLEPIPANNGLKVPERSHLERIIELAHSNGSLVIFDEVISGFRVGLSGASGYYDLQPDIVTLGKVIGGGLPLAAIAGSGEIMGRLAPLGDVYQAGTLSGNPLATAAGCAALRELFENPPYEKLQKSGEVFVEGLREAYRGKKELEINQLGSIFWMNLDVQDKGFPPSVTPEAKKAYGEFFRHGLANGVYFAPSPYEVGFLSTCHTPEILSGVVEKMAGCWK